MMIKTQTAVNFHGLSGVFDLLQIFGLFRHNFPAAVITAVGANPVGKSFLAAVAALDQLFWF
jgi:hypothetical protein